MSTGNAPEPASLHHGKHKDWSRDGFLISTDPSLISIRALTCAFEQDWMYWAKPLPPDTMKRLVHSSLCFGLYTPTPQTPAASSKADPIGKLKSAEARPPASRSNSTGTSMIGFARLITDHVTFAYLTDVYVLPEWRGEGLAKWMIKCVEEVLEGMPHFRRSMLITGRDGPAVNFYEKYMQMEKLDGGKLLAMSRAYPGYPAPSAS